MTKIGIVGYGVVGQALAYGFSKKGDEVIYYDKFKDGKSLEEVVTSSEFIFVCLPTPFDKVNKRIDLSIMDENINEIDTYSSNKAKVVIIKSTVLPGTTRNYCKKYTNTRFCFNPEFLVESSSQEDFLNQDRIVIGAYNQQTTWKVADLYRNRFQGIPLFLTDPQTAEMVKYMANAALATKVILGNEIYDLCSKMGISYEEVKKIVIADKRIGSHLDVTSLRGFGGKCFPKDLVAFIGLFEDLGVDASLLKTVWDKNLKIRKVKDWEAIPFAQSNY